VGDARGAAPHHRRRPAAPLGGRRASSSPRPPTLSRSHPRVAAGVPSSPTVLKRAPLARDDGRNACRRCSPAYPTNQATSRKSTLAVTASMVAGPSYPARRRPAKHGGVEEAGAPCGLMAGASSTPFANIQGAREPRCFHQGGAHGHHALQSTPFAPLTCFCQREPRDVDFCTSIMSRGTWWSLSAPPTKAW
jgi:hypothetical protein